VPRFVEFSICSSEHIKLLSGLLVVMGSFLGAFENERQLTFEIYFSGGQPQHTPVGLASKKNKEKRRQKLKIQIILKKMLEFQTEISFASCLTMLPKMDVI
jgi:hypothetical protein